MTNREWVFLAICVSVLAGKAVYQWGGAVYRALARTSAPRDTTQQEILKCLIAIRSNTEAYPTLDKLEAMYAPLASIDGQTGKLLRIAIAVNDHLSNEVTQNYEDALIANNTAQAKSLAAVEVSTATMVALLHESVSQTKGLMHAVSGIPAGAGEGEDYDLIERAMALKQQYPEKFGSLEDALEGARKLRTYSGR